MNQQQSSPNLSHIMVVVGVDLSDVSEHLLAQTRDLVRSVDDAELHVVHVVRPESLRERLTEPMGSEGNSTRALADSAKWELEQLCESVVQGSGARWIVHTPVGRTADEITRVARDVGADIIVLEAREHDRPRPFHRSVVARIVRTAGCSVLTIRDPKRASSPPRNTHARESAAAVT
jgi:nucleotide-binding universal stress UspA family protein